MIKAKVGAVKEAVADKAVQKGAAEQEGKRKSIGAEVEAAALIEVAAGADLEVGAQGAAGAGATNTAGIAILLHPLIVLTALFTPITPTAPVVTMLTIAIEGQKMVTRLGLAYRSNETCLARTWLVRLQHLLTCSNPRFCQGPLHQQCQICTCQF